MPLDDKGTRVSCTCLGECTKVMPLTYLAQLCSQIDRVYSVSLQYGAHPGEAPCWAITVTIPARNIHVVRRFMPMATLKNIAFEAQTLGGELQMLASLTMAVNRGEETIRLDTYQAVQSDDHSAS